MFLRVSAAARARSADRYGRVVFGVSIAAMPLASSTQLRSSRPVYLIRQSVHAVNIATRRSRMSYPTRPWESIGRPFAEHGAAVNLIAYRISIINIAQSDQNCVEGSLT